MAHGYVPAVAAERTTWCARRWYSSRLGARRETLEDLRVCSGLPRWAYPRGGITIGDTYLTGSDPTACDTARLRHELVHRDQWRRHGYLFALRYLLAGRDPNRNRYEVQAGLADGGYGSRSDGGERPSSREGR